MNPSEAASEAADLRQDGGVCSLSKRMMRRFRVQGSGYWVPLTEKKGTSYGCMWAGLGIVVQSPRRS